MSLTDRGWVESGWVGSRTVCSAGAAAAAGAGAGPGKAAAAAAPFRNVSATSVHPPRCRARGTSNDAAAAVAATARLKRASRGVANWQPVCPCPCHAHAMPAMGRSAGPPIAEETHSYSNTMTLSYMCRVANQQSGTSERATPAFGAGQCTSDATDGRGRVWWATLQPPPPPPPRVCPCSSIEASSNPHPPTQNATGTFLQRPPPAARYRELTKAC